LLEIAFHLQSAFAAGCNSEPLRLALVARGIGTSVVIRKSVRVCWLCTESRGNNQFLIDFGFEASGHFFDGVAQCGGLNSEFIQLFFIGNEVRQVQFLVLNTNLAAHVHAKFLREGGKIDESLLLRVEDVAHERGYFSFGDIDFISQKVLLEVLVGDEAIPIFIELSKDVVHLVLAVKDAVLNRAHHISQTPGVCLILGSRQF